MIAGLRPFIRTRARQLAERLAAVAECEFVEDFANPLPLAVMSEMLGVPPEDHGVFHTWTTDIGLVFSLALGGDVVTRRGRARRARRVHRRADGAEEGRLGRRPDLRARRGAPGRPADQRGTTAQLIVTMAFAEHPAQWRLLGSRPDLADRAVDEVMRWLPSSPTIYRFAAEDFEYQGLPITEGTFLTTCVTAAQRDPRVFRDGATFDSTVAREAPLLQFGAGPHHCLGVALAKAELAEALPALATRLAAPAFAGPLTWRPPVGIHGPNTLPVRFSAGPGTSS
jgi:cytochrome P450